jgi:hypothetical protein
MKQKRLYTFYLKCLLLALPFILLLAFYIWKDPFMVLRPHHDYDHCKVCQNEGAVSWMKYKMYRNRMHYDSFIMGNSCTKAFPSSVWNQYVHGHPFRMFANTEDLGGICMKLEALNHQCHQPIRHLLLVVEPSTFINADSKEDFMHIMPPEVSHKSTITYQTTFLQGFFTPKFFIHYTMYLFTKKFSKAMNGIINMNIPTHEKYNNDAVLPQEQMITEKGNRYWQQKYWQEALDKSYSWNVQPRTLSSLEIAELKEIKSICQYHHTDLKIIISPEFNKTIMNSKDVMRLNTIFGPRVVYDFSSRHYSWMHDVHNFYDPAHYRVELGKKILKIIYR